MMNSNHGNNAITASEQQYRLMLMLLSAAVISCFAANTALANPEGATVVNGSAAFTTSGSTLTIANTPSAIINWQSFGINANETVKFIQQSASSAVLNRVTGGTPSAILGALQSNGRVFLINPSGIMFGTGSRIDVNGLVASTLNMSDADFLGNRMRFNADRELPGGVSNAGEIKTPTGGFVYLLAPNVENSGLISTPSGEAILAAGNSIEMVDSTNPSLRVQVSAQSQDVNLSQMMVQNNGNIFSVLNSGKVSANTAVQDATGKIYFKSARNIQTTATSVVEAKGDSTMNGGRIEAFADNAGAYAGAFDVSGKNGGFIETSGHWIDVNASQIIMRALDPSGQGGTWLLDPVDITIANTADNCTSGPFACTNTPSIIGTSTINSALATGNVSITTSNGTGGNGDITVSDAINYIYSSNTATHTLSLNADRDIVFSATGAIENNSTTGGSSALEVQLHATRNITFNSGSYVDLTKGTAGKGLLYANTVNGDITMASAGIKANSIDLFSGRDIKISGTNANTNTKSLYALATNTGGDASIKTNAARDFVVDSSSGASVITAEASSNTATGGNAWVNLYGNNSASLTSATVSASGNNTGDSTSNVGSCNFAGSTCTGNASVNIVSPTSITISGGTFTAAAATTGLGGEGSIRVGDGYYYSNQNTSLSFFGNATTHVSSATLTSTGKVRASLGIEQAFINVKGATVTVDTASNFTASGGMELGGSSLTVDNSTVQTSGSNAEGILLLGKNITLQNSAIVRNNGASGSIGINYEPKFIAANTDKFFNFISAATVNITGGATVTAYDDLGFSGNNVTISGASTSLKSHEMHGIVTKDLNISGGALLTTNSTSNGSALGSGAMLLEVGNNLSLITNSSITAGTKLTFNFPLLANQGWNVDGVTKAFTGSTGANITVASATPVEGFNFFATYGGLTGATATALSESINELLGASDADSSVGDILGPKSVDGGVLFSGGTDESGGEIAFNSKGDDSTTGQEDGQQKGNPKKDGGKPQACS